MGLPPNATMGTASGVLTMYDTAKIALRWNSRMGRRNGGSMESVIVRMDRRSSARTASSNGGLTDAESEASNDN